MHREQAASTHAHPLAANRRGDLRRAVSALYERNRQTGHAAWAGRDFDFVCPSHVTYPFQWFWDSCFHAIVLSHLDPVRAESEVRGLLDSQQDDGFISHVIFWQRERFEATVADYSIAYRTRWLSDGMQPPVLAEAVAAVAARGRGREFLAEAVPALRRYYDWCDRVRDPDDDGLIAVVQPDETGLDHTPKFDAYLQVDSEDLADFTAAWERVAGTYDPVDRRPEAMFAADVFVVEDVMVNTIYAENQRVLGDLLEQVDEHEAATEYRERAARTARALRDRCWDPERGLYFDLAGLDEDPLTTNTVTSLFPLVLPDTEPAIVEQLVRHLEDADQYAAPYPVPSVAMDEPSFRPGTVGTKLVWRGPTWMNTNWYLVRGLRRHGYEDLADRITERSVRLVEQSGFREYYDPFTGEGHGAPDFGWTGLVLDMVEGAEATPPHLDR